GGPATGGGGRFQPSAAAPKAPAPKEAPPITGSVRPAAHTPSSPAANASPAKDDDVSLGKAYFRDGKFSLAERHFRRAVELHPRDLESWIGLAACYDRQRRFDLADR